MKAPTLLLALAGMAFPVQAIVSFQSETALRGALANNMRPEVVAKVLIKVEDEWRSQALQFAECDVEHESHDCGGPESSFKKSCSTVINAVLQSSSGDRSVVHEYMGDLCGEPVLAGWRKDHCYELQQMLSVAMTGDNYDNRQSLDAGSLCHIFWSKFEKSERTRMEKEKAEAAEKAKKEEEAREKAEQEAKKKAQEAEEKAAAEQKAAEKRHKAAEAAEKAAEMKRQAEEAKQAAKDAARKLAEKRAEAEKQAQEAKKKLEEVEAAAKKKVEAEDAQKEAEKSLAVHKVLEAKATKALATTPAPTMSEAQKVLEAAAKELQEPTVAAVAAPAASNAAPKQQEVTQPQQQKATQADPKKAAPAKVTSTKPTDPVKKMEPVKTAAVPAAKVSQKVK